MGEEIEHEFHGELCKLVEEFEEEHPEVDRYELLRSAEEWSDEWLQTLSVTGATW